MNSWRRNVRFGRLLRAPESVNFELSNRPAKLNFWKLERSAVIPGSDGWNSLKYRNGHAYRCRRGINTEGHSRVERSPRSKVDMSSSCLRLDVKTSRVQQSRHRPGSSTRAELDTGDENAKYLFNRIRKVG